jgi:hypothetical protein
VLADGPSRKRQLHRFSSLRGRLLRQPISQRI